MSVKSVLLVSAALATTATGVNASEFEIDLGGRLQADYAIYDDDKTELDNGGEFRRARIFVKGQVAEDWKYKVEVDFAGGDTEVKDAYIQYTGLATGALTIGNQKVPQSLEEQTSSRFITFLERGLPNVFITGRRLGVGYSNHNSNSGFQTTLFGEEPNDEVGGHGIGARYYFTPSRNDNTLIHLGASLVWEDPEDQGQSTVRFRQRPESHVTSTRLVNTGTINDVDNVLTLGLEAAGVWGPFSLQGEWLQSQVNTYNGADYDFDGFYAQASYFLSGESRTYKAGKFDRIKPKKESGAWEIAFRYSNLDLTDVDVFGGQEDNYSFALNWYPKKNLRIMTNYIIVDTDLVAGDDDPNIFQVRAQVDF